MILRRQVMFSKLCYKQNVLDDNSDIAELCFLFYRNARSACRSENEDFRKKRQTRQF